MDATDLIPRELHEPLKGLGKLGNWLEYEPGDDSDGLPRTSIRIDFWKIKNAPEWPGKRWVWEKVTEQHSAEAMSRLMYMEMAAEFLANGPKIFVPTAEQFEAMCHVELRIAPEEFRSPYPALAVAVPAGCRRRLAEEYGVRAGDVPPSILVRHQEGKATASVAAMCRLPLSGVEEFHLFTPSPHNPTIETALRRVVSVGEDGKQVVMTEDDLPETLRREKIMARVLVRAALNCCLLLTHYGHREGGPLDPAAYKKHRAKKNLARLATGDYLTVHMTQDVVVRAPSPPAQNPEGPGTGIEVRPHWRKGHWCAYPGQGAKRAAGDKVPLYFRRPCLVRGDRASGDLAESKVSYHGV